MRKQVMGWAGLGMVCVAMVGAPVTWSADMEAQFESDALKVFCAPGERLFSVEEVRISVGAKAPAGGVLAANATGVVEARAGIARPRDAAGRLVLAQCTLRDGVAVSVVRTAYQLVRPKEPCRNVPYAAYEIRIGTEPALIWPSRYQQCMDGRIEDRALELTGYGADTLVAIGVCRRSQSGDKICVYSKGGAVRPPADGTVTPPAAPAARP